MTRKSLRRQAAVWAAQARKWRQVKRRKYEDGSFMHGYTLGRMDSLKWAADNLSNAAKTPLPRRQR